MNVILWCPLICSVAQESRKLLLSEQDALGMKPASVSRKDLVAADSRNFVSGKAAAVENNRRHPTGSTQH